MCGVTLLAFMDEFRCEKVVGKLGSDYFYEYFKPYERSYSE